MKFKEYFALTKPTTIFCLKVCGVIFTTIFTIIAVLTEFKNISLIESFEYFSICLLLGNAFGCFIWLLAITNGYRQTKAMVEFYNSIPDNIRERFGLKLIPINKDSKHNFLEMDIITTDRKTPLIIRYLKGSKEVIITIINELDNVMNFQNLTIEVHKKYKKQNIELTGIGLRKTMKLKEWNRLTNGEIESIVNELFVISGNENLKVYERK